MLAEGAVIGAEIVAPLRDAMRLVDCDEGGLTLGEHFREAGHFGDVANGHTAFADQARRAAGGNEFRAQTAQPAGEFDDSMKCGGFNANVAGSGAGSSFFCGAAGAWASVEDFASSSCASSSLLNFRM